MDSSPFAYVHAAVAETMRRHRVRAAIDVRDALESQLDRDAMRALEVEAVAMCRAIARSVDMGICLSSLLTMQCFHVAVLKDGVPATPVPRDVV